MSRFAWITELPVAHRGFHDMNKTVWENTISAFTRAIDAGFAIECDLQYVADGNPVIFHDDDMERLCGIKGDVREKTAGELALFSIGGTQDKIPSLRQLLRLTKGKVPLVLELKGRKGDDDGFADSVLEALDGYEGHVALMSFDHWLLKDLKDLGTQHPVGLTAWGNTPKDFETHQIAMDYGLDFISYCVDHLPNPFITAQRAKDIPVITWTVRTQEARIHTFAEADQMTFEGFDPRMVA
jgi:glycerophosphoryl diester phosphodiesterase